MQLTDIFRGPHHRRLGPHRDDRGHRHARQDRGVRADGAAVRARRDGAHGRDRDRPRQEPDLGRDRRSSCDRPRQELHAARRRGAPSGPRRSGRPVSRASPSKPTGDLDVAPASSRAGAPRSATSSGSSPSVTASRSARSGRPGRWRGCRRPDRFAAAACRCAEVRGDAATDPELDRPAVGAGLGRRLRLRARAAASAHRGASLPPALLVLPELSLTRHGGRRRRHRERHLPPRRRPGRRSPARRVARLASLRAGPDPARRPGPAGGFEIASALPPRGLRRGGARGRRRIRCAASCEKVVLAREVRVARPAPVPPGDRLRRPALRLPELLLLLRRHARGGVRRREPGAAGAPRGRAESARSRWPAPPGAAPIPRSTTISASGCCRAPRTATSTRSSCARIERSLAPLSVWVAGGRGADADQGREHPAPGDARCGPSSREPRSAVELAGVLHPTPGGRRRALEMAREVMRAGADGPRLVRRAGRLDGRDRGRRVLRRASLRPARGAHRPLLRGRRASSPTPIPRRSWPRPRSSSRRCCGLTGA